ncbi:alpha/beta hydrolase [Ramlibacter henchirensis]|uniref:Alpha/beta hydrolase n=1 Tax=Ramlibacter henchirensis TaxID=204072 RepID=A0A4Z0BTP0_9BURK|nr:alpha/beta hydrolase [Ramlibacter henchirensis]TFZ02687.1 alpha/beta hydrolase [Ramlibacter henchirensis]
MVEPDALPPSALSCLRQATRIDSNWNGSRVVWREWGDAAGRALVLLHGGSGSWTHWLRNIPHFAAAGARVLVPDLPGFGDSDALPGVEDVDGAWPAVGDGLQQLVGARPFDVAAFSFGGMVAGYLGTERPQLQMDRLVLVAPAALGLPVPELGLESARGVTDAGDRARIHAGNLGKLMLHRPQSIDAEAIALQESNIARDRMRRRKLARTDLLLRQLPRLRCDVHAIYGTEDALYREVLGEAEALLARAPSFKGMSRVDGAGHWVQYEAPAAFHSTVDAIP